MMDDLLQEMIDPAPAHHDAPRRRRLWTTVAIVGLAAVGATTLTTSAIFTDNDATSADDRERARSTSPSASPCPSPSRRRTWRPATPRSSRSRSRATARSRCATPSRTRPTVAPDGSAGPGPRPRTGGRGPARRPRADRVRRRRRPAASPAAWAPRPRSTHPATVTPWPGTVPPAGGQQRPGPGPGDRGLTVGTPAEWLCFKVDLPLSAGNEYQDAGVDARPCRSTPSRPPTTPEPDGLLVGRATRRPSRRPARTARDRSAAFSCSEAHVAPAPRRRAVDGRRRLRDGLRHLAGRAAVVPGEPAAPAHRDLGLDGTEVRRGRRRGAPRDLRRVRPQGGPGHLVLADGHQPSW